MRGLIPGMVLCVALFAVIFLLPGLSPASPVTHLPLREGISSPPPAAPASPGLTLEIAPNGSDSGDGTHAKPFATLDHCCEAIRHLRPLPAGGVRVIIHGGVYSVTHTLELTSSDAGTSDAPIVFIAAPGEHPVFSGGKTLTGWRKLTEADGELLIPKEARPHIIMADLAANGIASILPLELGGFASGLGFATHPIHEFFCNGQPMQLARGPNSGWIFGVSSRESGTLGYKEELPAAWSQEPDLRLYGYWRWDWADSYERPAAIDPARHLITLAKPWSKYGYNGHSKFYAINALSELDAPGEWYLDRASKKLLFYPPGQASDTTRRILELSLLAQPMIEATGLDYVTWDGLTWNLGAADALHFTNCSHVTLEGCTVSRFAGTGLEISGAHDTIVSCDIFSMGRGGIHLEGGDRATLEPSGNAVINCDIHDLSRIDHTYTPALLIQGVGMKIVHNRLHDVLSSAMRVEGNDHQILDNEIYSVARESDDQGGSDSWGDPTFRGIVFRANYWHHIGDWQRIPPLPGVGRGGIRLDDAISGVQIDHNIFEHCSDAGFGGVQINGGKDNVIENNLFIDCAKGVSIGQWDAAHWNRIAEARARGLDLNLYAQHYPAMKDLFVYPGQNIVRRNASLRCPNFVSSHPDAQGACSDNDARLPDDFSVATAPAQVSVPSLDPIALGLIGLYRDSWRTSDPEP